MRRKSFFLTLKIGLVALPVAGIRKALPFFRDELPVVTIGAQSQFQHTERIGVSHLAVWVRSSKRAVVLSAGADDKFADAALGVGSAIGSLRCETLVIVVVAAQDDVGIGFIERLPKGLHC